MLPFAILSLVAAHSAGKYHYDDVEEMDALHNTNSIEDNTLSEYDPESYESFIQLGAIDQYTPEAIEAMSPEEADAAMEKVEEHGEHAQILKAVLSSLAELKSNEGDENEQVSNEAVGNYLMSVASKLGDLTKGMDTDTLVQKIGQATQWADKHVANPFYSILVPKDAERRKEGLAQFKEGCRKFQDNVKGPFFFGESLSIVDIAALPWCFRAFTCGAIELYRGPEFALSAEEFAPLLRWLDACLALESVRATLPEKQALIDSYKRYADGTAESRVADAVRAGKAASEHA